MVYKHVDVDPVAIPRADVEDAPDVKTAITAINRKSPRRRLYKIISIILVLSGKHQIMR
jgi:hypothetical protein